MSVNSNMDFFYNCTSQSETNCSGDPVYECMDSFPGNVLTGSFILLNTVLMLPLNCWILWLASSDFVMLNQSVSEVISEISLLIFLFGTMLNHKVFILISCFLASTFGVGRPLFHTYFCVERYLAVVHPLLYLQYTKAPKIKLQFVGLVWLIILIFGWHNMESYPKMPIWIFMGTVLAMLIVCTMCSTMILWVLKRPRPGEGNKKGSHQLKRKAFLSVSVILITLLFSYGIFASVIVLRDQLPYHTYCSVVGVSWWTLFPSSAVQPYLYLSKVGKWPCINNF